MFKTVLQEERTGNDGVEAPITPKHVEKSLKAVMNSIFPHRALETQKLWMNKRLFKPKELSTQRTAAVINHLNNTLPLFPLGSEALKFSESEILGLLEWSLPPQWCAKFDLVGYIPSMHSKARLIEACEAIECNTAVKTKSKPAAKEKKSSKKKKWNKNKVSKVKKSEHPADKGNKHCKLHGKGNHVSADCWTLKKGNKGSLQTPNWTFLTKNFCKEINLLSKKSSKKKIIYWHAVAINKSRASLKNIQQSAGMQS